MVSLFTGSVLTTLTTSGLTNPTLSTVTAITGSSSSSGGCCCPSSTVFLDTLTNKLIEMTTSLQTQFADLLANSMATRTVGKGPLLANISIRANVQYKSEYFIYIMRYGPPVDGIFDPVYLDLIRIELENGTLVY